MTDAQVIDALGGPSLVAEMLGVSANTVSNWKARGIAWNARGKVQIEAKRRRVALPDGFLTQMRV